MGTTTVSTFLESCCKNNIEKVLELLDQGFSVGAGDLEENSGLQISAARGHEKLTEILIERGADIEKSNNFGFTPLMHAVCNDNVNIIMFLLNEGANVNSCNRYGMTPLLMATARGNSKIVKILAENGAEVNCKTVTDITPIMIAAQYRHEHLIGYFSRKGVNINEKTSNGITALMLAANEGEKSTIKALLDRGADPSIVNCRQDTAMNIALARKDTDEFKSVKVANYIHKKTSKKLKAVNQDTFLKAVHKGNHEEVTCRLQRDWLMSNTSRKEDEMSALMLASTSGDVKMIKILCHYGANSDLQDNDGWTALMWAAIHGHVESCKILLKYCNPYIKNNEGLTVADIMALIGNGDSQIEAIFEDLLVMGPCIKTEESMRPRKISPKKKFPNPLQWLKRTKKDLLSAPNSEKPYVRKESMIKNKIPVYLSNCGYIPCMNSMNFKFIGNDIRPFLSGMEQGESDDKEAENAERAEILMTGEDDPEYSDLFAKIICCSNRILNSYCIKKDDDVGTILKKMDMEQYVKVFKEELVEKEDFTGLTFEDLDYLEIKDSSERQKLMSVIRSLEELYKDQINTQQHF